jgi:hypothetical protein
MVDHLDLVFRNLKINKYLNFIILSYLHKLKCIYNTHLKKNQAKWKIIRPTPPEAYWISSEMSFEALLEILSNVVDDSRAYPHGLSDFSQLSIHRFDAIDYQLDQFGTMQPLPTFLRFRRQLEYHRQGRSEETYFAWVRQCSLYQGNGKPRNRSRSQLRGHLAQGEEFISKLLYQYLDFLLISVTDTSTEDQRADRAGCGRGGGGEGREDLPKLVTVYS